MSFNIEVESGSSVRLPIAGKYCDRDIVVTATGGDTDAAYQQGVTDGKQAEYDAFWDAYQQNGARRDYQHAFCGTGWTVENWKPKHNIVITGAYMMFRYFPAPIDMVEWLNGLGVTFNDSYNSNVGYMYFRSEFTRIGTVTLKNVATVTDTLAYCENLHTIDKIVTAENVSYSNSTFNNCNNLVNITVEGVIGKSINFQWSPLSKASIESVIEHLSSTASGMKLTLKKTAVENAFGSTAADEWTALIATKSNWTITLA